MQAQIFILMGSLGASNQLHHIPALRSLSQSWCGAIYWAFLTFLCILANWRQVKNAITRQLRVNAISIVGGDLTVQYTNGESARYDTWNIPPPSHEADGIYLEVDETWIRIPQRAIRARESFEEALIRSAEAIPAVSIPQPPDAAEFPFAVTYTQSKADVVHAYHNGWSRPVDRSAWVISALFILFGPMLLCFLIGLPTEKWNLLDTVTASIPVGLTISAIIGIPALLSAASSSSQVNMAQQMHPFEQPLLIALGKAGVAIYGGAAANIVAWNNVRNLSGDERLICFEIPDDLVIIPRTAFLDLKQADEFLRAAKIYKGGGTPKFGGMQAVWPPAPSQAIPK